MSVCSNDETNMSYCATCKYSPKPKDPTQLTWLMKRHYLSRLHTTNLRKKSGCHFLDLSDEGFLEYYLSRVQQTDDMGTRDTYTKYISHLRERIAMRITLEKQGQEAGYITTD